MPSTHPRMRLPDSTVDWLAIAIALAMFLLYELRVLVVGRRDPSRVARSAHGDFRAAWAMALGRKPGMEIVAVQTLRNSLMSATIIASTAALALMGSASIVGGLLAHDGSMVAAPRTAIVLLLMGVLFGAFVESALAMRMFSHAGYLMAFPVDSPQRAALDPVAALYLRRAGFHYSWSLRLMFCVAPLVAGLFHATLMPFAAAGLLVALYAFDRPPPTTSAAIAAEAASEASAAGQAADRVSQHNAASAAASRAAVPPETRA